MNNAMVAAKLLALVHLGCSPYDTSLTPPNELVFKMGGHGDECEVVCPWMEGCGTTELARLHREAADCLVKRAEHEDKCRNAEMELRSALYGH